MRLENEVENLRIVVIGGGGYIGFFIGVELHRKGYEVSLFDLSEPDPEWLEDIDIPISKDEKSITKRSMRFIRGNLTSLPELESAFSSVRANCVVHCASYGMSGSEQTLLQWDKTEDINVGGTAKVIKACSRNGIKSLIYTSTVNVIFGGQEIINGDEFLPYFPLHRHVDHYSRTKSIAEQLVLIADSKKSYSGQLRTCALRLAGVMGVKEKRHLPRIVGNFPILKFYFGPESKVQFVSLPNVVQAHVKAVDAISKDPDLIGGQAYFISDGTPINNFMYFKPIIEKLGYSYPKIVIPMWIIWLVTYVAQIVYSIVVWLNPGWAFTPFLSPCEVFKTSVTHYFSIEKAKKHFDYVPSKPNDVTDIAQYYYEKIKKNA